MAYDLLKYRGLQTTDETPSMLLLYYYGKYKKDRETSAQAQHSNPRVTKTF